MDDIKQPSGPVKRVRITRTAGRHVLPEIDQEWEFYDVSERNSDIEGDTHHAIKPEKLSNYHGPSVTEHI